MSITKESEAAAVGGMSRTKESEAATVGGMSRTKSGWNVQN